MPMTGNKILLDTSIVIEIFDGNKSVEIVATLYKKGKPIPTNDVWIAAIAKQHGFTLITRDKHFNEIEDLIIRNW